MRNGLIWFIATLLVYALILYLTGAYMLSSFVYHTLLLIFPLGLILLNRANIQPLGLMKGQWQTGLSFAVLMSGLVFFVFWQRYGLTLPSLNTSLGLSVIYAPITEELFFRGYLQPRLESRFGKWLGLGITATLFTIIHLPKALLTPLATPIGLVSIFILGVVFGVIRDISGSVYYAMLGHMGYNFATSFIAW